MRLGVFGGTFDPVHYGHLLLAECCREQCRLDALWFVPAAVAPHKQDAPCAPAAARIEMLELAVAGHPSFSVNRYEADLGGVNYTVDTLAHLREEAPQSRLFFLLGADMLHDLPTWREPAEICRLATLVVVARAGAVPVDFGCLVGVAPAEHIERIRRHQVAMPPMGLSSTEIRRRAAAGQSIRYQTPRAVEQYIAAHGLYVSAEE